MISSNDVWLEPSGHASTATNIGVMTSRRNQALRGCASVSELTECCALLLQRRRSHSFSTADEYLSSDQEEARDRKVWRLQLIAPLSCCQNVALHLQPPVIRTAITSKLHATVCH